MTVLNVSTGLQALFCRYAFRLFLSSHCKLYNIQNLLKYVIRFQITNNRSKQIYKRCLLASIVTLDPLCKEESVSDVYVHKREGDLHLRFCNLSASSGYNSENTIKHSNQLTNRKPQTSTQNMRTSPTFLCGKRTV